MSYFSATWRALGGIVASRREIGVGSIVGIVVDAPMGTQEIGLSASLSSFSSTPKSIPDIPVCSIKKTCSVGKLALAKAFSMAIASADVANRVSATTKTLWKLM